MLNGRGPPLNTWSWFQTENRAGSMILSNERLVVLKRQSFHFFWRKSRRHLPTSVCFFGILLRDVSGPIFAGGVFALHCIGGIIDFAIINSWLRLGPMFRTRFCIGLFAWNFRPINAREAASAGCSEVLPVLLARPPAQALRPVVLIRRSGPTVHSASAFSSGHDNFTDYSLNGLRRADRRNWQGRVYRAN